LTSKVDKNGTGYEVIVKPTDGVGVETTLVEKTKKKKRPWDIRRGGRWATLGASNSNVK